MGIFGLFNKRKSLKSNGLLQGAVDRHSHILYGVDDGIKTLEDSLAALAVEQQEGIREVWCTPHVMEDVPNSSQRLRERFAELCSAYDGDVKLMLAAEYMLDNLFEERLAMNDLLTMEDDVILVETSALNPPVNFYDVLRSAQKAGFCPMLAHPERYRYLRMEEYDRLLKMGVRLQLNLASLVGFYGETARTKARNLLAKGAYTAIGTDCHRVNALTELFSREELDRDMLAHLNTLINDAKERPAAG